MNNKFKLLDREKDLLLYMETYILSSIPKTDKTLRQKTSDELHELIKNTMKVSVNVGNIKNKSLNDIKVNIMMLDFYLSCIYSKKIIINKRYMSSIRLLTEIKNIVYSLDYKNEK